MSKKNIKPMENLQIGDFEKHPVWEYINDDELGESMAKPVVQIPVNNMSGRVCGTKVKMANGNTIWAALSNLSVDNEFRNKYLLSVSLFVGNQIFHLARYHDVEYDRCGPNALSKLLGFQVKEVFPISYNLRGVVHNGSGDPVKGQVLDAPVHRLSRIEIIDLAVSGS